jgi:hypothetical protein
MGFELIVNTDTFKPLFTLKQKQKQKNGLKHASASCFIFGGRA